MGVNAVAISGNLTRDAMLKPVGDGFLLTFTVAVGDAKKVDGRWEETAHFVDCALFGTRAERIAPYMLKGMKVAVQGKLVYRSWEQDGQKRSKLEVRVSNVDFMGRPRGGDGDSRGDSRGYTPVYETEDVPF